MATQPRKGKEFNFPLWYDFHEWKEFFAIVRDYISNDNPCVVIISTNEWTSGYWLEVPDAIEAKPGEFEYRTKEQIFDLFSRVERSIKECEQTGVRTFGLIT